MNLGVYEILFCGEEKKVIKKHRYKNNYKKIHSYMFLKKNMSRIIKLKYISESF